MSRAQERLWFLDRLASGGSSYNIAVAERFTGPLDAAALQGAFTDLVARHEALRTVFPESGGRPSARVRPAGPVTVERLDATEDRLPELLAERSNRPFDLAEGPLLRLSLLRLGPADHVLLLVLHHIIGDAWSLERILFPELSARYAAHLAGDPAPMPGQARPYSDYARRQRERDHDADLDFWSADLAGVPALDLPLDRPRPAAPSGAGGLVIHRMPIELWEGVRELARAERCTPFMVMLAAYQTLMSRYSGQDDFCVGVPIAGREEVDDEQVFGPFVNTLALRADLDGDPTVRDLVKRVRRRVLRSFGHREVPFDEVVGALRRRGDDGQLVQTMLNLDNPEEGLANGTGSLNLTGLDRVPVVSGLAPAKFDLAVDVIVYPAHLQFILTYSSELFEPATVERMAGHLRRLLEEMVARPGARLSELDMLTAEEFALVLPDRLDGLIAQQTARTPDAPAVVTGAGVLTYAELDRRAALLAAELDLPPGSLVGVRLRAGTEAMVALLAVLKAGAAYVPIDPFQPEARTQVMLDGCAAVISEDGITRLPGRAIEAGAAYVIYTSGSTGVPKGVVVEHRTAARLAASFRDAHGFGPGQRVLMVPPLSFDASVGDIFPALISGAALVLHPDPASLSGPEVLRLCADLGITMIDTASALWQQWVEDLSGLGQADIGPLTTMMVGGESVPIERLRAWAELTGGKVAFYNHYGPTEATVCATVYRTIDGGELPGRTHLPIGHALPHVRAYVLDRHGNPAPIGVPGELHLGGECVARGYLGRPEQTAERFLSDPFLPGATRYATGDLVRRHPDGTLDFLGRIDRQLKINGVRIEPGEVESACLAHPGVRECVVTAVGGRLVAYLVGTPPTTLSTAELRGFLADRLPPAMVPTAAVMLESVPLTPHGKVDFRALPEPDVASVPYESPKTATEQAVADVWAEVLGGRAGRFDNFFDLGGHSLLTPRTVTRLAEVTGVEVPLATFFACADLAELAAAIDGRAPAAPPDLYGDAVLPADFAVGAGRVPAQLRRVLLTGATGFLGAHLLADLMTRTQATVHCLVRGADPGERIRRNLAAHGLWREDFAARIVPVPGDLSRELPGLPSELDLILHNGGAVDFTRPYARLKPANVDGTLAILRLAARTATPVHLVSTLGVYLTPGERVVREGDLLPDPGHLHLGYDQSKWVADRLAAAARETGLPVAIHRPARISGDSRTGRSVKDDFLARFFATCAQLGSVPAGEHLDMAPVDHVAAAIGHLARSGAEGDFHYHNPRTLGSAELARGLTERGIRVRLEPADAWRAEVRRRLAAGEELPLAAFPAYFAEYGDERGPSFDCSATASVLAAAGLVCPPADTLLGAYLDDLIDAGVLQGALRA
ncbi:thioester reductase domain-containing protein [Nonomuraea sp. NN258]|uniref:non-ribosomal peptide synthetase n=1 Tax=Nonomuraea antri TaxID=2730852 RepID=UPI001568B1D3|nr:thioester reductase domain-containing protein [Nonomuraea antri]NRQ30980.1 thioester reductase domain-containing protein [Nonomuraea antri]